MIDIEITDLFTGYVGFMLTILLLLWIRISITFHKGWKIAEDQVIQCRECSCKFIIDALSESAQCPNCRTICKARWRKSKKRHPQES